jgi:cytochrome c oxidase cbb3-type subunit 3
MFVREAGRHRRQMMLAAAAIMVLAALAAGAYLIYADSMEASLLRADPDMLPARADLMPFAVARGSSAFRENCAGCHGAAAKGDSTIGAPDLTDKDWLYGFGRVSDIQQTVKYGIRSQDPRGWNLADMPAFSHPVPYDREKLLPLSPDDVSDVVQFLYLQEKRPADRAAADRGQRIFDGRGGCWDCHGSDGQGDNEVGAPNLTDNIWLFGSGSRADISDVIENGRQGVCPAWVERLSAARILEVSLYVYSLSHNTRGIAQ